MISGNISLRISSLLIIVSVLLAIFTGCEEKGSAFTADFNYEMIDDNNVRFRNASAGEYYSLSWDFANGTDTTTTNKNASFTIYYPEAGDYNVSLKVLDFSGNTETKNETITISNTDFSLSFTATVDGTNPNYVNLENTSKGTWDSFTWYFRGDSVVDETEYRAYLPFAGKHEIKLKIYKDGNVHFDTKTVNITQDDPEYLNNYNLVWTDEFDGSSINISNWTFETGAGGWGNAELQNYTNGNNAEVKDGKLIITAKKVDDNKVAGSYTSTRMITKGKQEFTYGRMEIKAKLPSGTGVWPAIWMLGGNISDVGWPACGELDIMEYVGYDPNTIHATVHTTAGSGGNGDGSSKTLTTCEEEFHIYGMIWNENEVIFYTDSPENVTHTYAPASKNSANWPFDKPQFFILNIAVGGSWGGVHGIDNTIFPQTMEVDYVQVYKLE